jgi:hypothetical protein
VSTASVLADTVAALSEPALPTIWWSAEPGRDRRRSDGLRARELAEALEAACAHIRALQAKVARLEAFAQARGA